MTGVVPRSIGGFPVVGIIGTDGDVVAYAGEHPEHGTVAMTILSSVAAKTPGAVEEYLSECERRSADPAEADVHIAHGLDGEVPYSITKIRGIAPTIHPLPPPVNRMRRRLLLALAATLIVAVILSVLRSSDVATLSPDERSWAVDLVGEWDRTEADVPLTLTATDTDSPLVVRGAVQPDAPSAAAALEAIRTSLAAAESFVTVDRFDEPWSTGADVVDADGGDRLIRIVDRPCAAFVLTVESTDGAFSPEARAEAEALSATFRRIGVPATFEKGAEAPDGFDSIDQNGVRIALPADSLVDGDSTACLSAELADTNQTVTLDWVAGADEAGRLAEWEADVDAVGGTVVSEAVTGRGKQRRVATTDGGSLVRYVVEDGSGVYSVDFSAPGVAELGASDLVVFDLIASTFEVTGTSADPS